MRMKTRTYMQAIIVALALLASAVTFAKAEFMPVADANWPVRKTPTEAALKEKVQKLSGLIKEIEKRGLDASYARSTLVISETTIVYATEDEANGRPGRARYARGYLDEALDAAISDATALLKDPRRNKRVPHPVLKDIAIRNGMFYAGKTPVVFGGVGHFGKVRQDIPKFPDYGFNLIQIEIGPSAVVTGPEDSDIRTNQITDDIVPQLDNAAKNNIMINLLLSPHYFPQWALEKYPNLKQCGHGFLQYCISDPDARRVIERYLRTLIPYVKDKPALQSYTLANEPQFWEMSNASKEKFRDYLKGKYKNISELNRAWKKNYSGFEQVTINEKLLFMTSAPRYDWMIFHNKLGTDFFRWMTDVIRSMDKRTPVHIKFMGDLFDYDETMFGIDREALDAFTEISGNDAAVRWPGENGYALRYHRNAAFYDFLKSVQPGKPVQNSENHIIADDSPDFYPENYIRAALWLQSIHGMSASTIWVWERSDGQSLGNNILSRPNCVAAATRATLDMRRLAGELNALQNAPSPIAVYYSQTARTLQMNFGEKWDQIYDLTLYQGRPVRMITDRMLAAGLDPKRTPVLTIPEYIYATDDAYGKLIDYVRRGGHIIAMSRVFRMNETGRTRDTKEWDSLSCGESPKAGDKCIAILQPYRPEGRSEAFGRLHMLLTVWAQAPQPSLFVTGENGSPVFGVEYRSVDMGRERLGFVFNALDKPVVVKLSAGGKWRATRDLIDGGTVGATMKMQPMDLVMIKY